MREETGVPEAVRAAFLYIVVIGKGQLTLQAIYGMIPVSQVKYRDAASVSLCSVYGECKIPLSRSRFQMDVDVTEKTADERYRESIRIKQGVYTICFVLLCLIDQIVGSAMGRVQFVAANCTGFVIAVIIFTGYRWKDFMRLPYAVWTVFCIIGGYFAIHWGRENYEYYGKWVTAVLNVAIYGYLVLRILIRIFQEKRIPRMNWRFLILWVVMMLCMVFSRNEAVWPVWFLMMFGCFYLTEYTKEELDALFNGMLNGIIIGFCILQGFATMFRAFDDLRYASMYTNGNMYALFCVIVQAAILGKWYRFKRNGAAWGWRLLAVVGSGIVMAYCFLTICRTAMIAMMANVFLLTVIFFFQEEKRRVLKAAGRLAAVLAAAVVSFPVVFQSIRTIPAEFYSPMLLAGDAGNKIQGGVPAWDDRYIEMDEFLEAALGRLFWFFQSGGEEEKPDADLSDVIGEILLPSLTVYAAEDTTGGGIGDERRPWGSGLTQDDPVLTEIEDIQDDIKVRWAIYKTYLVRLNLWGHEGEEGVWVSEGYFAPHPHNFLLEAMYSYGIVAGILFLGIMLLAFLRCMNRCVREPRGMWYFIVGIFMISSYICFGTLEIDWRVGQLSYTMIFVVQYLLLQRCDMENKTESMREEGFKAL